MTLFQLPTPDVYHHFHQKTTQHATLSTSKHSSNKTRSHLRAPAQKLLLPGRPPLLGILLPPQLLSRLFTRLPNCVEFPGNNNTPTHPAL
jgi:hypothetical protein